jgi:hypoxanthine phosphoribosyltransferase
MPPIPTDQVLYTADEIQRRIEQMAITIARDYRPAELIVVAVLKGSFMFLADLVRRLTVHQLPLVIDFVLLSSYGRGAESAGTVQLLHDLSRPVAGRRVLLVDDILDTGLTLQTARELLIARGAREVRTCVLLDKPFRRRAPVRADYIGFTLENVFAVGYGLDHDGHYRQLPYLAALPTPPRNA